MKALTAEELREMAGQPVWCPDIESYGIIEVDKAEIWKDAPFLNGINFNFHIQNRGLTSYRVISEKEIPMELVSKIDDCGNGKMVCPSCGEAAVFNPFRSPAETYPYCPWCGQKLKGETE